MEEQRSAERFGAVITKGPTAWQILQREPYEAVVKLKGKYYLHQTHTDAKICVRVLEENTCRAVFPWREASRAERRSWQAEFRLPTGGPYRIETKLDVLIDGTPVEVRGDMISHLYVGDLYVVAGQSNAVGFGREAVDDAPMLGVHMLRGSGMWDIASHPLGDTTNLIHPINRDGKNPGHSPWLTFAKMIYRQTGVPVGLIPTALGGSALREWDHREGVLYANMVDIVKSAGRKIRGVLWYQGCADAHEGWYGDYLKRFMSFVRNLREDLNAPELPIFTVQLNRFISNIGPPRDEGWGTLREAQRQAALQDQSVFVVPSMDGATTDGIHNSSAANLAIGARVANLALSRIYGKEGEWEAPDVEDVRLDSETTVVVRFRHVSGKLSYLGKLPPFHLEDSGGAVALLGCEWERREVRLQAVRPFQGKVWVSYQDLQNPDVLNIFDSESLLPALAFYRLEAK